MENSKIDVKPIIFSGEMVRAILDGRKTQTRRVITPQPVLSTVALGSPSVQERQSLELAWLAENKCSYGRPGDLLWVRETWASHSGMDDTAPSEFTLGAQMLPLWYRADGKQGTERGRWRPSIHMPRWASRITLRVTDVKIQRLHDITLADAIKEGTEFVNGWDSEDVIFAKFAEMWNSINAKRGFGWDNNPWVWVVAFEIGKKAAGRIQRPDGREWSETPCG